MNRKHGDGTPGGTLMPYGIYERKTVAYVAEVDPVYLRCFAKDHLHPTIRGAIGSALVAIEDARQLPAR